MSFAFSKLMEYESGEKFFFRYEGLSPSSEETLEVSEKIKKFMEDIDGHDDIYRNVVYLKTILRDCKEKLFVVSYTDILGNYEETEYNNGKLYSYKSYKCVDDMMIRIENSTTAKFQIAFCNLKDDFVEYGNSKNINKYINDTLLTISSLKKAKPIRINEDAKELINIYNSFYGENPDFNDKNISDKIQAMMNILDSFNISLGEKYQYAMFSGKEYPFSMDLESLILTLKPLGKIVDIEKEKHLTNEKKINLIGKTVNDSVNNINDLLMLSKVVSMGKEYGNDIETYITDINKEEVELNIQKVKKIKERIGKKD